MRHRASGIGHRGLALRRCLTTASSVLALACAPPVASTSVHPAGCPMPDAGCPSWADSTLATLSLRDRAAQMVWPQVFADYVSATSPQWRNWERYLGQEHVGGIIVSIGSPTEMAAKLNAFQRMSPLPLLVGSDIEGGVGFRARGGYFVPNGIDLGGGTLFPHQMALGASRDSALAYELGRITAVEGRALGIHIAYAPVLDVNSNPNNPVIGIRSFGEDPALVARLGVAVVRGIQDHGMIATGKHFPGHGDVETNSHLGIAAVTATRARLDSMELVPFRAAIAAGVGSIMTAHIALPAITGDSMPATLEPAIMTGLLRRDLGFDGLLTTDAMDMHGVLATLGLAEATKRAVAAGADVVLMPEDVRGAIEAIVAGVTEGRYPAARVDSSVRRILAMKARLGLVRQRLVNEDSVRWVVGDSAHLATARLVAERGITLVRDSGGVVPLLGAAAAPGASGAGSAPPRVLSVTLAPRADLAAGRELDAGLRAGGAVVRSLWLDANDPEPAWSRALAAADSADVTIIGSYAAATLDQLKSNTPPAGFAPFVHALAQKRKRAVVVAFGNPYLLRQIPEIGSYMIAWGGYNASQWAAARALLGRAPITGRLPVGVAPDAPFGAGLRREAVGAK